MAHDDTHIDDVGQARTMAGVSEAYCSQCEGSFPSGTEVCPNDGTRLVQFSEKSDRYLGKLVDERFEVLAKLGEGGMGDVYRAMQRSVGREVAIKVVKPELSADRASAKRFLREAKLLSRVSHPNVVVVHDMGQDQDGALYLVMELVTGKTLAQLLEETPNLPAERIRNISLQVCEALVAAHSIGVIHRDLKPSNILVTTTASGRDSVKVLDFGLAKSLLGDDSSGDITSTGMVMGTPLYVSPEMITGDPVDARADLYSLGCLLYEMCTGTPPFVAETPTLLLTKHITEPPMPIARADVGGLWRVSEALLRKTPAERPADAATVGKLLAEAPTVPLEVASAARAQEAVPAPPAAEPQVAEPQVAVAATHLTSRRPSHRGIAIAAVVAGIAIGGVALALRGGGDSPAPPANPEPAIAVAQEARADAGAVALPDASLAAAAEVKVEVRIETEPQAEVLISGQLVGTTPLVRSYPKSSETLSIELRAPGFLPETREIVLESDALLTDIALRPETQPSRRRPKKKRPTRKPKAKPERPSKPKVDFIGG